MANPVADAYGGLLWPDASGVGGATADAAAKGALEAWSTGGAQDASGGVDLGELPKLIEAAAKGATVVIKTIGDVAREPEAAGSVPPANRPPIIGGSSTPSVPRPAQSAPAPRPASPPPVPVVAPAKQIPTAVWVGGGVVAVSLIGLAVGVAVSSRAKKRRAF